MLAVTNKNLRQVTRTALKYFSTVNDSSQKYSKEKYDLLSAVSLERRPVITREFNELEQRFSKQLQEIEYERSYKSNFEVRMEEDVKRAKEVKEGNVSIVEMDSFPQQTAQDFLDASVKELDSFTFGKRRNEESIEKNVKSLDRALDRHLLLLVNEQIGQTVKWLLPQGTHQSGETLRQTAERVLKEKCGTNLHVRFLGNAPVGFYKYRYPKAVRSGESVGAKIFFFKAELLNGQVQISGKDHSDFMWATRTELQIVPYDYLKSVKMFLIDEEH